MNYAEEKAKLLKELKVQKEKAEIDRLKGQVRKMKYAKVAKLIKKVGKVAEKANRPQKRRKAAQSEDMFGGFDFGPPKKKKGGKGVYNPYWGV